MNLLNMRMQNPRPAWDTPRNPNDGREFITSSAATPEDNPFVPSGYTYLLQLIAHDMVFTTLPFWAAENLEPKPAISVRPGCDWTRWYGCSFTIPGIYVPDTDQDHSRTKLQLGQAAALSDGVCPFRDIGRLTLQMTLRPRSRIQTDRSSAGRNR